MRRHIVIDYHWNDNDGKGIRPHHVEALEESAFDRITAMAKEGYHMGDLHDDIVMKDEDGGGVSYSGWWGIKTTEVRDEDEA